MKITEFPQHRICNKPKHVDIFSHLDKIKNGFYKAEIESLRERTGDDYDNFKDNLTGACFNGTFTYRKYESMIERTGLIILDFDKFETKEKLDNHKQVLIKDPYTFAVWISPGGNGLKLLVKIPKDLRIADYFRALKKYYNHPNWDDKTKDESRFTILSYDPDLYLNTDSDLYIDFESLPKYESNHVPYFPLLNSTDVTDRVINMWKKNNDANTKGSRNTNLFKLAILLHDYGIYKEECLNICNSISPEMGKEIPVIVRSAYSNQATFGSKQLEDKKKLEFVKHAIRSKKSIDQIIVSIPEYEPEKAKESIEKLIPIIESETFWYLDEKSKIKIDNIRFKVWLEANNIFRKQHTVGNKTTYIIRDGNLIDKTDVIQIKDLVLKYANEKDKAAYQYLTDNENYFNEKFLTLIDVLPVEFRQDTKELCYLYYKNCIVQVTANHRYVIEYDSSLEYVWKSQVIQRNYDNTDHHESEFRTFIWKICGQNVDKYNSFKSVIGYLCHSHKMASTAKAVVLNDMTISDNPNGGSGKGIFGRAISHIKRQVILDGKTFDFNKSFLYQQVDEDTQILFFDDINKHFPFEKLFSVITEGISIEKKGLTPIKISVEKSPKVLISTNYTIKSRGGSFERRLIELELSDYFSHKFTPIDEFGHNLFDDWDETEWKRFDSFMINCITYYLQNGIVAQSTNNLLERKLINDTNDDFVQWSKNYEFRLNYHYDVTQLYDDFVIEYGNELMNGKRLINKRFKEWMNILAEKNGWLYKESRLNWPTKKRTMYLGDLKNPNLKTENEPTEMDFTDKDPF
jgi:hypothetical protein